MMHRATRYAVAIVVSGLALWANLFLAALIEPKTVPLLLIGVLGVTWYVGLGPGLVATAATALANDYFFVSPGHLVPLDSVNGAFRALVYVGSALLVVALAIRVRMALQRAEANAAAARDQEESLRERESRLRAMLEGVTDYAIFMLDPEGRVMSWNTGAERIKGYRADEIVGQPFARFYPDEDVHRGKPAAELAEAVRAGRFEEEGWRTRKDGTRFWANVVITPVYVEGNLLGFSKVTRDVSDRRTFEDSLRASEARFRTVLDLAPDAIVIVDRQGRIALVNSQAQQVFGYSNEELLGARVEMLLPEKVRDRHLEHRAAFHASPRTRPMGIGLDLSGRKKDGTNFPVEISLSPMETAEGTLVISIIRDISDRKLAETRIKALNEDLERRVAELANLNRELEAFSYSVSHDLRAPLRGIDGFGQALAEEYGDRIDEQGQDYLRRIRAATQRMGELIDDLLNLSRVTRRELRRERVNLSALARTIATELEKSEPGRRAEFRIADGLVVSADAHLLRVALENLLGNAWKFTSKEREARIELGVTTEGDGRAYFVRDNGVGFDMTYSGKLFGAFQRLHRGDEFPGTGIGLATVHRIVTRHGGRIWVEAAVGQGATFYFTL